MLHCTYIDYVQSQPSSLQLWLYTLKIHLIINTIQSVQISSWTHRVVHTLVGPPIFHLLGIEYFCFPPDWHERHCKNNMLYSPQQYHQIHVQCHLQFVEEDHNQLRTVVKNECIIIFVLLYTLPLFNIANSVKV